MGGLDWTGCITILSSNTSAEGLDEDIDKEVI